MRTSGSACSGDSTIQPKNVTVVKSTISGANSSTSEKKPVAQTIANEATPSGNLSATKTRPFQVIGSRSQRTIRSSGAARQVGRRRDRDAEHGAGEAALDRGHAAPGRERGEQDPEPDDQHGQRRAGADADHEHDEVGQAEREGEQEVEQVQPCLRPGDDAGEPGCPASSRPAG